MNSHFSKAQEHKSEKCTESVSRGANIFRCFNIHFVFYIMLFARGDKQSGGTGAGAENRLTVLPNIKQFVDNLYN